MKLDPRPPRVSEAKVTYHLNTLQRMFARANDADFLQMIWALDALQSGREEVAKNNITSYPPGAAVERSIESQYGIHRWELETALVQLLLVPKEQPRMQGNLVLDCRNFEAARQVINRLRSLENVEAGRYLSGDFTIFGEMHRIAQRQFHWQHGYFNTPQIYRYAYIYTQAQCADYFRQAYGFESTELILAGFGLYATYLGSPWVRRNTSLPAIGLTEDVVARAIPMLSCSRDEARAQTTDLVNKAHEDHGSPVPTALLPSILRRTPLLYVDDNSVMTAPIPEAILLRVTAGLYYDLLPGGQEVINEANSRFEQYCAQLVGAFMKRFVVSGAEKYGPKGHQFDTPDILIKDRDQIVIVGECKATKLTYLAQFAEDPFAAAKKQYAQIAKGVFQLWRYFSHVRRGLLEHTLAADCSPIVITLDWFMPMAGGPNDKVFVEANVLADQDGNILPEDRRRVSICPIVDLESVLATANEDMLLAALRAWREDKYRSWMLPNVHRDTGGKKEFGEPKRYPFDLSDVLPWWNNFEEQRQQATVNNLQE